MIQEPRTLGIDASNIRGGGGVTHLIELLSLEDLQFYGFDRIKIWGCSATLNKLKDKPWLIKFSYPMLEKSFFSRVFWQCFILSKVVRKEECDILLVPGGSFAGSFSPVVIMSQNLLPFEFSELRRYGCSLFTFKLILLRLSQSSSIKRADGVIFLSNYAARVISNTVGFLGGDSAIIPHGINQRFYIKPRLQRDISEYDYNNPYRIIYVSRVDQYKHQWHVVEAISILRELGFPVELDLIGPAYLPALQKLNLKIKGKTWVKYYGEIDFDSLHLKYFQADLGLFASSCENLPNILLETMAAGLPIACSNKGPMPELLGNSGMYFDPESPQSISDALLALINSKELRYKLASASYKISRKYSWSKCTKDTFNFINAILEKKLERKL